MSSVYIYNTTSLIDPVIRINTELEIANSYDILDSVSEHGNESDSDADNHE